MANHSPPSSTPVSNLFQTHHMKFRSPFSTKVEEKPPVPVAVSVSSTTPLPTTPRSTEVPEASPFETADEPETPAWDYFGLSNPTEQRFPAQEGRGFDQGAEKSDGREDPQISDDEFDEPATASLVRRFKNVNMSKENHAKVEDQVLKDFVTSKKIIDQLFARASESGREVPKMLEANKLHFRKVVIHGKQRGSASLLKSCFSCGDDPSQVPQEPPQETVNSFTWPRTESSPPDSSLNLLTANYTDGVEDLSNNLLDNFCMAGEMLQSNFDQKCKLLLEQAYQAGNTDKTRAAIKGLHSRIRVSVHRIKSISKKIEEIRD
ncbi:uncharacterized protein LOC121775970 [Salvia splendens]|uniref:uncharacterized protein LOC121775970 n=1 Tax=Salvia splendens TaxID=180675 RepID=UPI001C27A9D9|nr:uncharacterized protein LOC121775970 [Salvia splendens]